MRRGLALLLLLSVAGFAPAVDSPTTTVVKWDIARTSAPESVDELKALQDTVKKMVERTTPSTVALFYEGGAGSGAIISDDGIILTAAHVVSRQQVSLGGPRRRNQPAAGEELPPESKNVSIMLADGTRVKGTVLGRNKRADSAMVKITSEIPKNAKWDGADKGKWPAVELGKSSDLKKGQWVVSLGHPGGPKTDRRAPARLGQMVTVSEKGNRVSSDCTLVGGDSGGPLFDLTGKLIGIHTSIGMDLTQNFHIPLHTFQNEWARLVRGDRINEDADAYIGFVLNGDEKNRKVKPLIEEVKSGTPAANAGLQDNDVILELNGEKVATSEDVDQLMSGFRPNQRVVIKVKRGDDVYELELTLGKRAK